VHAGVRSLFALGQREQPCPWSLRYRRCVSPHRLAARVASCLSVVPSIDAVVLFGSVARGDDDRSSDIDLLVVSRDADLDAAAVRARLPHRLRHPKLAVTCIQPRRLRWIWRRGDVFAHHLSAERRILFDRDGAVTALMASTPPRPPSTIGTHLARAQAQLLAFDDLSPFRGELLFVLSSLYTLAKGLILTDLTRTGTATFNRQAAFEAFSARHPALAEDIRTVAELQPFYETVTRRRPAPPAVAVPVAEAAARSAITAVQRICRHLQGELHAGEGVK
jgi:predicted nucleotidyltransferase